MVTWEAGKCNIATKGKENVFLIPHLLHSRI